MTPVDQFLHSVQESFAANRSTSGTKLVLVVVAAVALSFALSVWNRRRRARREVARELQSVLSGAGLSNQDLEDLTRIAAVGLQPLREVMTVRAAFEHATARLLAGEGPVTAAMIRPAAGSWFERVRRLRQALGFSPLSAHLWLLSTRELVVGDGVATGGIGGHVAVVNEASFAVDWPLTAVLVPDAPTNLTIDRVDDARYLSQARLLSLEALPALTMEPGGRSPGRRAFFAHDEQPERQQDREHMRLRVSVSVKLRMVDSLSHGVAADPAAAAPAIAGKIVDVSAGGLSLNLPVSPAGPLIRGAQVLCWFALDGDSTFAALAAMVVGAEPPTGPAPGEQHLRLSFVSLEPALRDRLATAVARHQGAPPPSAVAAKP
jgi:PilZ domain